MLTGSNAETTSGLFRATRFRARSSTILSGVGLMAQMDASPLEEMIGKRLPVLDDGFVRVVDYMGGDSAIVQAARISYGEGTKRVQEDRALIRLPYAPPAHDSVRNVRDQVPRSSSDGHLATVDSPQNRQRERILDKVTPSR